MRFNKNLQKRMWLGTVWLSHVGDDVTQDDPEDLVISTLETWWERLIAHPNIDFARGQIEISDTGHYHIQVAVHTTDSKRWGWMINHHPAHWEPASKWDAVVKYVGKTDSRIMALEGKGTAPNLSKTNDNGSAKKRAIAFLKEGKDPKWIAIHDPDAYFTHHRAIDRLYQMVYMAWSGGSNEEEE